LQENHVVHLVLMPEGTPSPSSRNLHQSSSSSSATPSSGGDAATTSTGLNTMGGRLAQTRTFTSRHGHGQVSITTNGQVIGNPSELLDSVLNAFGGSGGSASTPPPNRNTSSSYTSAQGTPHQHGHGHHHGHDHAHAHPNQHQNPRPSFHQQSNPAWTSQMPQDIGNMHRSFHEAHSALSRLSSLLSRESTLSPQEQEEVLNLRTQSLSYLDGAHQHIHRMASQVRNMGHNDRSQTAANMQQTFHSHNTQQRPTVQNINVHVHATMDQLDELPDRLSSFTNRINLSRPPNVRRVTPNMFSSAPTSGHGQSRHTVTIIGSNAGTPEHIIQQLSRPRAATHHQPHSQQPIPTQSQNDTSVQQNAQPQSAAQNVEQLSTTLSSVLTGNPSATPANVDMNDILTSDRTVGSVMRDFGDRIGIQTTTEETELDAMLSVIFDHINVLEIMGIINGQWSPLDRLREPLRQHMTSRTFRNDVSPENRRRTVESGLIHIAEALRGNAEFMNELDALNKADSSIDQFMHDFICISRTYLRLIVDTMLDGPESVLKSGLLNEQQSSLTYGDAMHCVISFYLGESVDLLFQHVEQQHDVERVVFLLSKRFMSGLPDDYRHMETIGGNMSTNFIFKEYNEYKRKFQNRSFHKTEAGEQSADLQGSGELSTPNNSATTTSSWNMMSSLQNLISEMNSTQQNQDEDNTSDDSDDMLD